MSSKSLLMALDAGGGGGHCLLVDIARGAFTRAFRPWTHPSAPGTSGMGTDLDLDGIWTALGAAAREAMEHAGATPADVAGIAATSMRHTTIVLDAHGTPLLATPNRDSRAVGEAIQLANDSGDDLYTRTGHWPSPIAGAARLLWFLSARPEAAGRAATAFSLSDWVTYRLCGEIAAEPSQAGESLLVDLATRDWARDVAERLGIPGRIFPALQAAGTRIGSLTAAAAHLLGLTAGIPVGVGGADTQCGVLGTGAVAAGDVAAIAGTTTPVQLVLDRACLDPQQRLWTSCHVVPGLWVLESNAGMMGEALDWLARVIYAGAEHPVAMLLAEAGLSQPGAAGILSTFGTGVMNARDLRLPTGSLTLSHLSTAHDPERRRHLARAVVEGMAHAVRANLEQIREVSGIAPTAFRLGGGMSRSHVFAQLLSDILDLPVQVSATSEATALGAAICAGTAAGTFASLEAGARALSRSAPVSDPDGDRARTYRDLHDGWRQFRAAQQEAESVAGQLILPSVLAAMTAAAGARQQAAPRPRILVTADLDGEALAALGALGDVEYASFRTAMRLLTGPSLVKALEGVQVFVTEVDVVDAEAIRRLPELRVIASCRGEAVNIDPGVCTAFGIPVLHAPGRNAESVADLTVAFLLMLARKLAPATAFLRQPGIDPGDMGRMGQAFTAFQGRELWRKTIGLVGFGAVGRAVAKRLAAFGARILVHDPYLEPEHAVLAGAEPADLDNLLARSDFVSLHAAVTDASRGLIGAAELARMKPEACLVNTARAALVDEEALAEALRAGTLGGAALDVFSVEPPGSDHPLLAFDTVIATPHIGGNTTDVASHQGRIIADDLARLLRGEPPRHALNPEVLDAFDWNKPRPQPDATTLAALAARPKPAVSDIQRARPVPAKPASVPPAVPSAPSTAAAEIPPETRRRMEAIVGAFVARIAGDPSIRAAAAGADVTLHFTLSDFGLEFFFRLRDGAAAAGLGRPDPPADVELKMRADIFDGMFTGRVNPMEAATSGRLSFSGDTLKAMTLQDIQADLSRLYAAARAEVGDPGDLASLPDARGTGPSPARVMVAGDIREEMIQVVNELYASALITATGGNVSVRLPDAEGEIWITPSQLFKGNLRPEILVRLDLGGRQLDPDSLAPSSERLMHCAVYRARPDARAVVHAHAPHATVLGNTGLPFVPVSTEAAFFGDIPRVPFLMPGTEELAATVGAAIRDGWAVLLQNHGVLVAGRSLRRAADMVEIIERSSEIILGCHAVGKEPRTLPDNVVQRLRKMGDLVA